MKNSFERVLTGVGTGLLDRRGVLFECNDREHSELAIELVEQIKVTAPRYSWPLDILLYGKGYIHLGQIAGIYMRNNHKPTQSQLDMLWDISQKTTSEYFRAEVLEYIEKWQSQD